MRTTLCSSLTRCLTSKLFVLFALALLAVAFLPATAFAQNAPARNCIQNEWNLANGDASTCTTSACNLNCTANDVQIAEVINVRDFTGKTITSCTANNPFSFIADFEIVTTSKSTRSNIGLYIAENGTTVADALSVNNTCADNIIPPPPGFTNTNTTGKKPTVGANGLFQCPGASTGVLCGTDWFDEYDTASTKPADNCGDTSSSDDGKVNGVATAGAQQVTLEINGFTCPDPTTNPNLPTCTLPDGSTGVCAVLPNCTSWQVPGKTTSCVATPGTLSYPNPGGIPEAVPGDKSKCNCGVITLPILIQKPVINVLKGCTTLDSPAPSPAVAGAPSGTNLNCSSGVEGQDEVTYTVEIDNSSNFGDITVNKITDDQYGDIAATCPGGSGTTACAADSTTCSVPQTIHATAGSNSYTCTFTAHKSGDPGVATVTDIASASGTTQVGPFTQSSNSVTVTPTEAPALATVTKGLGTPNFTAACVTANFSVDVKNTSNTGVIASTGVNATTFDESETLLALSDSVYQNIATPGTLGTGVLSSSCVVPQTISAGADYTCGFSAQFCTTGTTLQTLEEFGTGTCNVGTGKCSAGQPSSTSCAKNSDCDLSCLGVTHTNTISATIQGDEATGSPLSGDLVTPTANVLTTNVCLVPFTQSQ